MKEHDSGCAERTDPHPGAVRAPSADAELQPGRVVEEPGRPSAHATLQTAPGGLLHRMWRSLMQMHGSPHKIAAGAALGIFIAFTPTFGIQLIMVVIAAWLLRVSAPAGLVSVWVTNVFTLAPIYAFCYIIGRPFVPGADQSLTEAYQTLRAFVVSFGALSFWEVWSQTRAVGKLGWDMFLPMLIGGCLLGLLGAATTYPLVYRGVLRYRQFRARLQGHHAGVSESETEGVE